MTVGVQLSSGKSAPNSGNNHHLTIPFEGGMQFQATGCMFIPKLKVRIRNTIENFAADMLQTVWNKHNYRVDVCRITKVVHIEHL